MNTASQELIVDFGLSETGPPCFYRSLGEVEQNARAYSHIMRRAWEKMGLNGILCVNGKPTVYFKEVASIDKEKAKKLHWRFWNQGTATLLVIVSRSEVHVYSGLALPAKDDEDVEKGDRLVEILDRTASALEEFVGKVEAGQIYQGEKSRYFNADEAIDRHLLQNLKDTRDALLECDKRLSKKTLHALLGRTVFTCYLTAREIIGEKQFRDAGAEGVRDLRELLNEHDDEQARDVLYHIFDRLKEDFNGSMFDEEIDEERRKIKPAHIGVLRRFLNVEEMATGQMGLPFWEYDFSVIPVETISAIYEEFIEAESQEGQRSSGAFYTPRHLAELVVDVATEELDSLLGKRFLDCAAGSGIFLVVLFNRVAEELRRKNPGKSNAKRSNALREILTKQLCGVDVEETACRITCFSLYLALLDHLEPREIEGLKKAHGKVLPPLLALKQDGYETSGTPVIYEGNFFDPEIPLDTNFDLVIGNPPWIGRNQIPDPSVYRWCDSEHNPASAKVPRAKAERKRALMPNNQVAHAFMWKAPLHVRDDAGVCLLLPAKVFMGRTDAFQAAWFSRFKVEKILNLSDMSFLLFEHALCPSSIVKYLPSAPDEADGPIDYAIPKTSREDPRRGVISIGEGDRWQLKLTNVIRHAKEERASLLWKKYFWSTPRDLRFLEKFFGLPPLSNIAGKPKENKRWITGQGFQPDPKRKSKKPYRPWWKPDDLFIDVRSPGLNLILLKEDCSRIQNRFPVLYRSRYPKIFQGPMVLINQGFTKISFVEFDVLFKASLQSISGPTDDADYLMLLAAVLTSDLAKYFLFHTAANWGTERDKVHFFELLRMPFPLPEDTFDPRHSKKLIQEVARIVKDVKQKVGESVLDRDSLIERARERLEALIHEYYDMHEREIVLIEDTVKIWEPSSTPQTIESSIPALREPETPDRKRYADLLCKVLNEWAKRSKIKLRAEGIISRSSRTGIITLYKVDAPGTYKESTATEKLQAALRRINNALPERAGRISYLRGLTVFDKDRIHIIKPLAMRHWTRTAALNDADEIAAAILSAKRSE